MITTAKRSITKSDLAWIEREISRITQEPDFIVIDLFCGAGGTTIGIEEAYLDGKKVGVVIAAVNHDWKAIKSHWTNHKHVVHFEEDIRTLSYQLEGLLVLLNTYRKMWPNAKVILWASLECTHFSKAKGGQARKADSRTLARSLYMQFNKTTRRYYKGDSYIQQLNPDYIHIENVVEFLSWGPLDSHGQPVKEKKGMHFRSWCKAIKELGYNDDWKMINAADHGAYTKRTRLFGCFAKRGLPIIWPESSHSKHGDMFTEKWLPVKHVLDFDDEGVSVFPQPGGRKKYMSPKTYKRVLAGCEKFIPKNEGPAFLLKYNSTNQKTGVYQPPSIDEPAPTISTQGRVGLITPKGFLANYYSSGGQLASIDRPAPTLCTKDTSALIQPVWVDRNYTSGGQHSSIEDPIGALLPVPKANLVKAEHWIESFYTNKNSTIDLDDPCPTITTKPHEALVKAAFVDQQYGKSKPHSIEDPIGALPANPKNNLIQAEKFIVPQNFDNGPVSIDEPMQTITANRKHHYLVNPMWSETSRSIASSVEDPCFTLVASMDSTPPYLVTTEHGYLAIEIYPEDPPIVVKLKEFMAAHGIIDIKMRMLRIPELKKIQGFPDDYHLYGNQSDQKKFIGNSVHPLVPKRWYETKAKQLREMQNVA